MSDPIFARRSTSLFDTMIKSHLLNLRTQLFVWGITITLLLLRAAGYDGPMFSVLHWIGIAGCVVIVVSLIAAFTSRGRLDKLARNEHARQHAPDAHI